MTPPAAEIDGRKEGMTKKTPRESRKDKTIMNDID